MPYTILLILFLFVNAYGKEELIRKTVESDSDKDGKSDIRMESDYKGDQCVMHTLSRRDANGNWQIRSISLFSNGNIVCIECDEDGDGFFESIETTCTKTDKSDRYIRRKDGSIVSQ